MLPFKAKQCLFGNGILHFNDGQMTRTTPEPASLSEFPHHVSERASAFYFRFNLLMAKLYEEYLVESGFEPENLGFPTLSPNYQAISPHELMGSIHVAP
ncbi:hypothetical protein AVEN_225208-1 [Araneus ventricosus]|uniref:Uncharacterized protein n=1 Tax=Araneus ventricosus TaxID=182803 RepID=A0A4Y2AKX3_ARAVE|nr:hypothetical protein AVEN_225208-1 [Araneus ventricosus]